MKRRSGQRIADPTAWARAISNSHPPGPDEVAQIMGGIRTAYERLKTGADDTDDYYRVVCAINVGIIRGEAIHQDVVDEMNAACEALLECAARRERAGRFGFSGPEMAALNAALDRYAEILSVSTPNQMEAAVHESMRRMRRAGEHHRPAGMDPNHAAA